MTSLRSRLHHFAVACATLTLAGNVWAQHVWLDDRGVKQYSDIPPPASIPASRILKGVKNAGSAAAPEASSSGTTKTAPMPSPNGAPMSPAEKNAAFQKRRIEQAEKDKKAADQEKLAAEKTKNCERAREYQRVLESGSRITRTAKDGERAFMSDDERVRELRDARNAVQECKS